MPRYEMKTFKDKTTGEVRCENHPVNASAKAFVKERFPEEGFIPVPSKEMSLEDHLNNFMAKAK